MQIEISGVINWTRRFIPRLMSINDIDDLHTDTTSIISAETEIRIRVGENLLSITGNR